MSDNFSIKGFKPKTDFADKVVEDVKKKYNKEEEIVIPFKTEAMQKKDDRENEVGVPFGKSEVANHFNQVIDKDKNGKISSIDELNAMSDYVKNAKAEDKNLSKKAKEYVDNLYKNAEIHAGDDTVINKIRKKFPEVNSKNINQIEKELENLRKDTYSNAQAIDYLSNLRDAYWIKRAPIDDYRHHIAETNNNDLSKYKVGD